MDPTFNCLLVISSFLTFGAICLQAWIYHRQWEVMQSQLDHAKDVQKSSNRAWVLLDSATLQRPIEAGERPTVTVVFGNHGKTPAVKAIFKTWFMMDTPYKPYKELERPPLPGIPSQGVHAPGEPMSQTFDFDFQITEELLRQLREKKKALYVHGIVEYDDVFGDHWHTEFCTTLNVELGRSFNISPDGNRIY